MAAIDPEKLKTFETFVRAAVERNTLTKTVEGEDVIITLRLVKDGSDSMGASFFHSYGRPKIIEGVAMTPIAAPVNLRDALLQETLDYVGTNFSGVYSGLCGRNSEIDAIQSLRLLPSIDKKGLLQLSRSVLKNAEFPEYMEFSSGTTARYDSSPPYTVYHSNAEYSALQRFQTLLAGDREGNEFHRTLGIELISAVHGASINFSRRGTYRIALERPFHYAFIKSKLLETQNIAGFDNRIAFLAGTCNQLKVAAELLRRDAIPSSDLSLKRVFSGGSYLSRRWGDFLRDAFGCSIINTYGISEVLGAVGIECSSCEGFHLADSCFAEVLNFSNDECLSDNRQMGELVLTGLYPFVQTIPILRYRTGDIVKITRCGTAGDFGFRYLGRIGRCPTLDGTTHVLPTALIYEILDDLPWIARRPYIGVPWLQLGDVFGTPIYSFSSYNTHERSLIIDVASSFEPSHFRSYMKGAIASAEALLTDLVKSHCAYVESVRVRATPGREASHFAEAFH